MPGLTCKDCPYWDDAPLRATSSDSIGYCRFNAPRAGTSVLDIDVTSRSERDFPVTWDDDWCRPGREEMERAKGAAHVAAARIQQMKDDGLWEDCVRNRFDYNRPGE
jgi:hypothetical protein